MVTLARPLAETSAIAAFARDLLRSVLATPASPESWMLIAGVVLVLGLEVGVMGWSRASLRRLLRPSRSTAADLFFFGGRILGYQTILVFAWSLGAPALASKISTWFELDLLLHLRSPAARVSLAVLGADFAAYWIHRARHAWGWWWELHKVHHAAEDLNVITAARAHPLDLAGIAIGNSVTTAILGIPFAHPLVLLAAFAALAVHAGITHSMLPWTWGWFGRYVLFSPVGHRIHHSPLAEHENKNFGTLLPIWDWIFGTLYSGDRINDSVGLPEAGHNRTGLARDLVHANVLAGRALFDGFRRWTGWSTVPTSSGHSLDNTRK